MSGRAEEPEIQTGSREQLLHLLAEAAEIEHSLMCSYLYAAFSLRRESGDGLAGDQVEAVGRWRKAIMGVAVEEMGHLLLIANLTVAVGGRPHFARPNFPIAAGYFPSDVVVRLSGFSAATLDHFVFLERPRGVPGRDSVLFDQPSYEREQAHDGLMPAIQDYRTIGHLYDAIRANLRTLCGRLSEARLFLGGGSGQVGPGLVDLPGTARITDLASAEAALDLIVEQGEGSAAAGEGSHYQTFIGIREELRALSAAAPGFAPAFPVADNPVLRRPPDPEGKVFIEHPDAAALLDFSCAAYGLLLRVLVQCFGRARDAAERKDRLVKAAFALMHLLGSASTALARLPADHGGEVHAGMTFTMLRGVEPLLEGAVEDQVIAEQLQDLIRVGSRLAGISKDGIRALQDLPFESRPGQGPPKVS